MSYVQLSSKRFISPTHPCYFIAEIGQNHQGSLEIAKELITAAKYAGADCVKFQKTSITDKFTPAALERPYKNNNSFGDTYGEHKKALELTEEDFRELKSYAEAADLEFSVSPKDIPSLKFLLELDVPFIKIGSGDSEDFVLLKEAAASLKPLIISTGMMDLETLEKVYMLVKSYHSNFIFLHCVSSYPTQPEDANLNVISTLKRKFPEINIGYSGHEVGYTISLAAAALGVKVIERHITMNKSQKGSDHACSLIPSEFRSMVEGVQLIELAMGSAKKSILPCEMACYKKLGKTILAASDIPAGTILSENDLILKVDEPKGIPAKEFFDIVGRKVIVDVRHGQPIQEKDLFYWPDN